MNLSHEIMYEALFKKDKSFEGIFIAAVRTTRIFCRPTCKAKKPKPENVEFFETATEALKFGYRPCKVCRPLEQPGFTPDFISRLLNELEVDPSLKITSYGLLQRKIEPSRVRRWFQANHGVSFAAYQRMFRINNAFGEIKQGSSIIEAAMNSGYESLSGFTESFRNLTGSNPSQTGDKGIINMHRFTTDLGPMVACANSEGLCLLEFAERYALESELKDLSRRLNSEIIYGFNPLFAVLETQLNEYFKGERLSFDLPLLTPGSPFQVSVWNKLREIPYGETRSYKDQAEAMGQLKAIRAIASANGQNRIAIIIPCHRVIGSDGSMTGYAGGIWRKEKLLALEKRTLRLPTQESLF